MQRRTGGEWHDARTAVADVISRRRSEIERRWMDRVRADLDARHLRPSELKDGIGDYLERIAEVLRGDRGLDKAGAEAWRDIARAHAITRVRQGFDVTELVHELVLLRRVIAQTLVEAFGPGVQAALVMQLVEVIDAGIKSSIKNYVDSRDYAARRLEAEHIGFLTHELLNPLNAALLSAAQVRLAGLAATGEVPRTVARLERALHRAREMIDNVMLVQRLQTGKVGSEPREVTLGELLDEPVDSARQAAHAKGLRFLATYDGSLRLRVDPELTGAALQNLLDNAIKYTDDGEVSISADVGAHELRVDVHDTCPGLSRAELRTIFEPFERGQTDKVGTGLGLAIARRAIEAQGGTIAAESPGEEGCHFWFRVPRIVSP